MKNNIFEFYLTKNDPQKSCLLALRDIILNQDELITETLKYGMPCFCWKKKPLCYLWMDKNTQEPYILVVDGKHLNHPKLEVGSRKRMKIFRIDPEEDLPLQDIEEILNESLRLHRSN